MSLNDENMKIHVGLRHVADYLPAVGITSLNNASGSISFTLPEWGNFINILMGPACPTSNVLTYYNHFP